MSDILKQFGLTEEQLREAEASIYPRMVSGRVAHIDADFMAYQAAADTIDELSGKQPMKTLEQKFERAREGIDYLRKVTGSQHYVAHITPSGSNKGGREHQAVTLPYQGNRVDRDDRPEHLDAVRHFIATELECKVHLEQEADDGLAQANYKAIETNRRELSIIVSKDKDLRMVPGLHWDFEYDEIVDVDGLGSIYIDDKKKAKQVKGWGTKYFWAQCLMGDAADNIKGLPITTGYVKNEIIGPVTKAYQAALKRVAISGGDANAKASLLALRKKQFPVGPVIAHELLKDCETDVQCYKRVRWCYQHAANAGHVYKHHKDLREVTPEQALFGDMQTLWMRRTANPFDVIEWLKEKVNEDKAQSSAAGQATDSQASK